MATIEFQIQEHSQATSSQINKGQLSILWGFVHDVPSLIITGCKKNGTEKDFNIEWHIPLSFSLHGFQCLGVLRSVHWKNGSDDMETCRI